jgi:release factor glutamine methyltransferase
LVERGLEFLKFRDATEPHLLDLATGSGCLLLALLKNHPAASGIGVDLSAGALETAARNARRHGLEGRVQWLPMDLREPWPSALAGPFDLITANLPYVSEAEYPHLEPELKSYEPRAALVAGPLGTEAFHWVLPNLSQRLQPGGLALLELGSDQGEELRQLAQRHCPELAVELARDLSGRDRVLSLKRPGK